MTKGLVFEIRRFCVHDGPGIRTTLFFKGCPLSCWWCHNPESQDFKTETSVKKLSLSGNLIEKPETTGSFMTVNEVMAVIERDRIFYDESNGGVTFSGGEPLMQEPFLEELLIRCKQDKLHTAIDTSGYASPTPFDRVSRLADLFLYDLKLADDALHRKYTGVSNRSILRNLEALIASGKAVILRFPVVPGITDTEENIFKTKAFINSLIHRQKLHNSQMGRQNILQIDLLPYHSMARKKYRRFCKTNLLEGMPDLSADQLLPLKKEFETLEIPVHIGG